MCGTSGGSQPCPSGGRALVSGTVLDLAGALWNHAPVMRDKMRELKIGRPQMTGGEMADLMSVRGLDDPFAIIAAMWNHAPRMEDELRARGLSWPRFESGQAADLAAYLLLLRGAVAP